MREFFLSLKWTVGALWRHHRKLLLFAMGIIFVRGLLPAVLALTARGLINSATALVQDPGSSPNLLYVWLLVGFFTALAEAISTHLNTLVMRRMRDQVNSKLTVDILDQASKLPLSFFEDARQRELIERAKSGATGRVAAFLQSSLDSVTRVFQTASLVVVLAYVEPLVLVIVGPVALPFLLVQWRLSKKRHHIEMDRSMGRRRTGYFSGLLTSPRSVAEIKLLGIARHLVRNYEKFIMTFKEQDWRLEKANFRSYAFFSAATAIAFYLVLARVAISAAQGSSTIGDLAIFGGAAVRIRLTLERAIARTTSAMEQLLFLDELRNFLEYSPATPLPTTKQRRAHSGEVEFRGVSFTYPGSENPVLKNFSLHVNPGEKLAIVGRNGAGKTTFVKLLGGLYSPDEGTIILDGVDSRNLALEERREIISVVMQYYGKYETTAAENLAYGNWEALRSRPELVKEVAERSQVSELIESLPDGYNTVLGRSFGEHDLSEGQWQKLAIARGFARECPVLVLDEPTASLDARSEMNLFRQFSLMARDRTTILISHRFSTIGMADRIAVVDGGRVIETGSHDDLMERQGHYADLYSLHYKWVREGRAFD